MIARCTGLGPFTAGPFGQTQRVETGRREALVQVLF